MAIKIEPATGWEWTVLYRFDGENPETMLVWAITPERALAEANDSLSMAEEDYQIFGLARADKVSLFIDS